MRPRLGAPPPSALWWEAKWLRALAALALSVFPASCGRIAGLDDYSIGGGEDGAAIPANPCGPNAVPVDGNCETVGVTECPNGASPDERGGCPALLTPAPCPTGVETFGSDQCSLFSVCGSTRPKDGASAVQYVDWQFAGDSDGTETKPWKTIQQALDVAKDGTAILIAKGEYREDLIVQGARRVQLIGTCPEEVTIRGSGDPGTAAWPCGSYGPKAAICVASSAPDTVIKWLTVTGGGDGIAIVGAEGVTLDRVAATETQRYGVRIEELWSPGDTLLSASATLTSVRIRRAAATGLYVAGATVEAQDLLVAEVRPRNDYLGYGVSVRPGATGIDQPTRSKVDLFHALLIGNEDAALHVAGSSVSVEDSFLGNLDEVDPVGRGVLVEREIPRGSAGDVTLRRSIVQRTRDAAIDVQSAALTLEQVTIRDTAGRAKLATLGPGDGCSGQGIRARTDRTTPAVVTVRHSLIDLSRQAAIHAHGASVSLDRSILRGSAPGDAAPKCAPHLGDGVTLHLLPGSRTELMLDRSIVNANARAAIAAFDGSVPEADRVQVSIKGSVLSCNAYNLVAANDPPGERDDALCGCGSDWHICAVEHAPSLEPWVSPGAGSGHSDSDTADVQLNVTSYLSRQQLAHGVAFVLAAPEIAPGTPHDGCATLPDVPFRGRGRVAAWGDGELAAAVQNSDPEGTTEPPVACSVPYTAPLKDISSLWGAGSVDFNQGLLYVNVLPGEYELTQNPESGTAWRSFANTPARANVDPGWVDVTWNGAVCSGEVGGLDGEAVEGKPNTRRVLVEPGMLMNLGFWGCALPQ